MQRLCVPPMLTKCFRKKCQKSLVKLEASRTPRMMRVEHNSYIRHRCAIAGLRPLSGWCAENARIAIRLLAWTAKRSPWNTTNSPVIFEVFPEPLWRPKPIQKKQPDRLSARRTGVSFYRPPIPMLPKRTMHWRHYVRLIGFLFMHVCDATDTALIMRGI